MGEQCLAAGKLLISHIGSPGETRTGYRQFLARWKDADPDIAMLKEAKAEYAKLRD